MTASPPELDVAELRRGLRARRRSLDAITQRDHGDAVTARTLEVPELTTATAVGAYVADDGELDLRQLVDLLSTRGAVIHLPFIDEDDGMRFRSWDTVSPLMEGRWGIPVPAAPSETRAAGELDAVIAPLVAADRHGTRIGRGAGYYDRALTHRLGRDGRPAIIGCAHHFQLVEDTLRRHAWDVPLDVLVTERETLRWTAP